MRLEVLTCDGCGADITDGFTQWSAQGGDRYGGAPDDPYTVIDACSPMCLVRTLSNVCDTCGVVLAPGDTSAQTHATWHERQDG